MAHRTNGTAGAHAETAVRIVQEIRRRTAGTQLEIAESALLSTSTVSTHVKELTEAGVLERTSRMRGARYRIARDLGVLVGVELTDHDVRIAVTDMAYDALPGSPVRHLEISMANPQLAIETVARAVREQLTVSEAADRLVGVGIAISGPVRRDGEPVTTAHRRAWNDVRLATAFTDALSDAGVSPPREDRRIWVAVQNVSSAGALGLHTHHVLARAARRSEARDLPDDLVFLRMGTGIGAGIVMKGHLVTGSLGLAGELGHVRADAAGPLCSGCGRRGCLESVASERAVIQQLAGPLGFSPRASFADVIASDHPAVDVALREAGWYVGVAAADAASLLNPGQIVLGGRMAGLESFTRSAQHAFERTRLPHGGGPATIDLWPGRDDGLTPELLGALALVMDDLGSPFLLEPVKNWSAEHRKEPSAKFSDALYGVHDEDG